MMCARLTLPCAQGDDKDPYVISMRGIDHKARCFVAAALLACHGR